MAELRPKHHDSIEVWRKPSADMYEDKGEIGQFRVWYIPQVPGSPFVVQLDNLPSAVNVLVLLEQFSAWEFDSNIKPDFSDASGIMRYTKDGWEDVDLDEYNAERVAIMEEIKR